MSDESSIDNLIEDNLPKSITPEKGVFKKLISDYGDLVLAMGCGAAVGYPYVLFENLSELGVAIWEYSAMVAPLVALLGPKDQKKGLRNSFAYFTGLSYALGSHCGPEFQESVTSIFASITLLLEYGRLKQNKEEVKV